MDVSNNTTTSTSAVGQQKAKPTLKLLQNKTHIGPVSVGGAAKASLSKAAGKIMFDSNLKVTVKETGEDANKTSDLSRKPLVKSINLGQNGAEDATYYMLAWDKLFGEVGSTGYQRKYQEFAQMQNQVYAKLGINLSPNSPKPELTEQQRRMYNAEMRNYAFSYYEYRLSFKQPGAKAVRSLTFRTLKPQDVDSLIAKLADQVRVLSAKLDIKARK